jgi:hypothetical protein
VGQKANWFEMGGGASKTYTPEVVHTGGVHMGSLQRDGDEAAGEDIANDVAGVDSAGEMGEELGGKTDQKAASTAGMSKGQKGAPSQPSCWNGISVQSVS